MSLNMSERGWILLNVSECLNKLFFFDYASILNMQRYSYNNIIITVTNVFIIEFLFARFVHEGVLLPFYLFYHELENNNES